MNPELNFFDYPFTQYSNRDKEFEIIYFLLKTYNFRISEILSLDLNCLVPPNTIIVKLKKSNDYYVFHDRTVYDDLFHILKGNYQEHFSVNYKEVYRWVVKNRSYDIIAIPGKHAKVTHAFRYRNAGVLQSCLKNEKQIQALLRHKSVKSQKYYLKKKSSK